MFSSSCHFAPLQLVEVNNFILIRKGCHILVLGKYGKPEFVLGTRWLFALGQWLLLQHNPSGNVEL